MQTMDLNQDTLRVLVATDTHLGYMEKDELRGLDSFNAFDEVCSIAAEKEVDFLLLGGDLFHENKPSRTTLVRTIEILRRYCLNNRPVKFKIVSDQAVNFPSRFGHVNFEDPYFNVGLPVFTIHGNHDDPAGVDNLSAVDILSSCNLVNYFGKVVLGGQGVGQITLNPILIRKGSTNVALYGLGNIRDERLNRMFQTPHAVQWVRPEAQDDCAVSEWFNIFVIHQNRVKSNPKNAINEHFLARFLDFVIWGHEHECLIDPQEVPGMGFHVTQPGSSVATSLIEGEAAPKHVLLLEIKGNQYRPTKIPLHSVRPFLFKDISFKDEPDLDANDPNAVLEFLGQKVQDLIGQVPKLPGRSPESQVPLVRLRVDYTGFTTINPQRFGQKFVGKVANPNDILLFTKASKARRVKEEEGEEGEALGLEELNQQNIEALVAESNLKMEILPVNDLGEALHDFVNKDDKQAFHVCVQHNLDLTRNKLAKEDAEQLTEEKYVIEKVTMHMQQREAESVSKREAGTSEASSQLDQSKQDGSRLKAKVEPKTSGLHDFSDDEDMIGITPARGKQPLKTTGRGRSSTKTRGEASVRGTAARGRGSRGGRLKQTTLADMMAGGSSQVRSSGRLRASSGSASAVVQVLDSDEEEATAAASEDEDDPSEVPEEEASDSDPVETPARGRKRAAPGTRGRGRGAKTQEPRAKRGRKSNQPSNTTTSYIEDDLEDDDDDKPAAHGRSGTTTTKATRRSWGSLRR